MNNHAKLVSIIHLIIFVFMGINITSCSSGSIATLDENFFICDSVVSTPVTFKLEWEPGPSDSVALKLNGGPCTEIDIRKEWTKEKTIQIDADAKKEGWFSVKMYFALSSNTEYEINYSVTVADKYLLDEQCILMKDTVMGFTEYRVSVYLPVARWKYFTSTKDRMDKMCWDNKITMLDYTMEPKDTSGNREFYDIKNKFTLTIESGKASVAFYNRNIKKIAGDKVTGRINELQKYGLILLNPYNDIVDDTISVFYESGDTFNEHKVIVSKDCEMKTVHMLLSIKIDRRNAYPGDTVNVIVSRIDENGNESFFPDSTIFEVGILTGCELGYFLNSEGEQDNYFSRIKQPIRLVVTGKHQDRPSGIRFLVGIRDEGNIIYHTTN